jgi:hypothetical protein
MIVVIQCAASKAPNAGHLVTADGKSVTFVAHPEIAPRNEDHVYARPDDDAGEGKPWREVLLAYNREPNTNPLLLLPAYRLYENPIYGSLVERLGIENVYILSAGWGLIRSDFLTPDYDITFSQSARRRCLQAAAQRRPIQGLLHAAPGHGRRNPVLRRQGLRSAVLHVDTECGGKAERVL